MSDRGLGDHLLEVGAHFALVASALAFFGSITWSGIALMAETTGRAEKIWLVTGPDAATIMAACCLMLAAISLVAFLSAVRIRLQKPTRGTVAALSQGLVAAVMIGIVVRDPDVMHIRSFFPDIWVVVTLLGSLTATICFALAYSLGHHLAAGSGEKGAKSRPDRRE
jgi:hypothetical protein